MLVLVVFSFVNLFKSCWNYVSSISNFRPNHNFLSIYGFTTEIIKQPESLQVSSSRRLSHLSKGDRLRECRLGLHSHADVSCIGKHGRILEMIEGQTCNVRPFNDTYKPITNVQTVNAAFAVDLPDDTTFILHVNQAFDFHETLYFVYQSSPLQRLGRR